MFKLGCCCRKNTFHTSVNLALSYRPYLSIIDFCTKLKRQMLELLGGSEAKMTTSFDRELGGARAIPISATVTSRFCDFLGIVVIYVSSMLYP